MSQAKETTKNSTRSKNATLVSQRTITQFTHSTKTPAKKGHAVRVCRWKVQILALWCLFYIRTPSANSFLVLSILVIIYMQMIPKFTLPLHLKMAISIEIFTNPSCTLIIVLQIYITITPENDPFNRNIYKSKLHFDNSFAC